MNWITQAINDLIIKSDNELHSRIELIDSDVKFDSTNTSAHFYFIKLDGNGNPRKKVSITSFFMLMISRYSLLSTTMLDIISPSERQRRDA